MYLKTIFGLPLLLGLLALSCSDNGGDSGGDSDTGVDTANGSDIPDSSSAQTSDTTVQQTDSTATSSDSQNSSDSDNNTGNATDSDGQTDTSGTADTNSGQDGSSDTDTDVLDSDSDTIGGMSPAMVACVSGMTAIGNKCGWGEDDLNDVYTDCASMDSLDEDAMTELFICAAQVECATWADDTASNAAVDTCIAQLSSDLTVDEVVENVCTYQTQCVREADALLTEQMYYDACVLTWQTALTGQPAIYLDLLNACVPETSTCSEAEVASFEGCFDE